MTDKKITYSKIDDEILFLYRIDLEEKHHTSTVKFYMTTLVKWSNMVDDVLCPSHDSIVKWAKWRRQTVSAKTFNSDVSALKRFYKWGYRRKFIVDNVVERLPKAHTTTEKLPRYLEEDQIGRLLGAPNLSTVTGFRDHVIMRLIYETGMKAGEVIALKIFYIDYEKEFIRIYNRRANKARDVPISKVMCDLLKQWVQLRRQTKPGKKYELFVTSKGGCFNQSHAIWQIVSRYADQTMSNIDRPYTLLSKTIIIKDKRKPWTYVYPTLLRNSFTVHLLRNGCDLRAVQIMLGHESINTTARYLELDTELLKREHSKLF